MARTQLTGRGVKDDSIESIDIKNGTIMLEDLSQEILDAINEPPPGGTGILDPFHNYVDKYTEESTTGTAWLTYLSLTTSSATELGQYRVMASYTFRIKDTNASAEFRFVLDGTDVISLQNTKQRSSEDERTTSSDFANRTLSGAHTITLQYRATIANRIDVFMKEAKLEIKRVTL